jgi:hypothetical protein
MGAKLSFETSTDLQLITRRYIHENRPHPIHRCDKLKIQKEIKRPLEKSNEMREKGIGRSRRRAVAAQR